MQRTSRRGFLMSAAVAGAAFGLDGPLEIVSSAKAASDADPLNKGFAKFKVGDWSVTTIYDGVWEKAHDPGFIKNATVDETKAALSAAGLTDGFVPITFTITVVERDGKTIMFDSGTGGGQAGGPKAGMLAKRNMAAAGIDPAKISTIVVTHFHPDHIFGLMEKDTNAQTYPNAEIIVPAAEYEFWTDPGVIAKLPPGFQGLAKRIQATMPTWKNIRRIGNDVEATAGIRAVNTNGHTAGHTSYELESGGNKLIVTGDLTNIAPLFVRNPGWHAVFDQDTQKAEQVRRQLFDRAIKEDAVLTGYHWGMPGAAKIKKDGKGYALLPVAVG